MSSETAARIIADMTAAMKKRDTLRTQVLRGLKSDLRYREIEGGSPAEEEDCIKVLRAAQKKRRDAIPLYQQGGRKDLADKEEAELAIIGEYLPTELSDAELAELIEGGVSEANASSPSDLGRVMKIVMPKVAGRAEGNRVRQVVTDKLAGLSAEDNGE
jgi:uncharacterized protein YqeY